MELDYSLIISIGSLLGVLLTSVKLLSYLITKARLEGVKDQKMAELEKDVDGIGRKVNHMANDHKIISDKVIEMESILVTKLDNIESLLKEHIRGH